MLVGTKKVIVSDPESHAVTRSGKIIITTADTIRSPEGTVETLDDLLKWAELSGNLVIIGQPDHLGDVKFEVIAKLKEELEGGQRINAVAIRDKAEVSGKFSEVLESHTDREDTGADGTVVGDLVTNDGARERVHDKPNEAFDPADLDISLVRDKRGGFRIIVMIHKRLDDKSGGPGVIRHLLMGDPDTIKVLESLGGFT